MKFLFVLLTLFVACTTPSDPYETAKHFADADTFPQMSNLPLGGDDQEWRHPHAHSGSFICWLCAETMGRRDHDGDGQPDGGRNNPPEGHELPGPPPPPTDFWDSMPGHPPPYGFQ